MFSHCRRACRDVPPLCSRRVVCRHTARHRRTISVRDPICAHLRHHPSEGVALPQLYRRFSGDYVQRCSRDSRYHVPYAHGITIYPHRSFRRRAVGFWGGGALVCAVVRSPIPFFPSRFLARRAFPPLTSRAPTYEQDLDQSSRTRKRIFSKN